MELVVQRKDGNVPSKYLVPCLIGHARGIIRTLTRSRSTRILLSNTVQHVGVPTMGEVVLGCVRVCSTGCSPRLFCCDINMAEGVL